MPTSEARKIANRTNASRSTGPRTTEGKEVSRRNGLKHGLTGLGIVLRDEDHAEVERRALAMQQEMQPGSEMGLHLVRRAAMLSVRVERCAELEMASTTARVQLAWDHFDEDQGDEAETLFQTLAEKPSVTIRRLERTSHGVARLIQAWQELKADLDQGAWTRSHAELLAHLKGYTLDDCHALRFLELDDPNGRATTKLSLVEILDAEVAELEQLLATFSDEEIEDSRARACALALFDLPPEVILARKYEAAAERGLYRALREARLVENQPRATEQSTPQAAGSKRVAPVVERPLGSSFPTSQPPATAPAPPAPPRKPLSPQGQASLDAMFPTPFSNLSSEAGRSGQVPITASRVR